MFIDHESSNLSPGTTWSKDNSPLLQTISKVYNTVIFLPESEVNYMPTQPKEAAVSHQEEVKPFNQVTPEEVAKASGGSVHYYEGTPIAVNYHRLGVSMYFGGDASCITEEGEKGEQQTEYPLKNTRVILEDGNVTFVEPAHRLPNGNEYYNWTTISEKGGFSRVRKDVSQRTYQDLKFVHEAWTAAKEITASS